MTTKYEAIIQNFLHYSKTCEHFRAAAIIGSRASAEKTADDFSDLDITILSNDPKKHIDNTEWLSEIGEVYITFVENLPFGNDKERRVMFANAMDVDFAIVPASQAEAMFSSPEIIGVFRKGFKILFDKDDLFSKLDLSCGADGQIKKDMHAVEVVENTVQDFWYHCIWSMKKIQRGEFWTAKMCVDGYMKSLMLKMIEWDYQLNQTKPTEIWHNGRFFEDWVDQDIQEQMKGCFSHYEREDISRALKRSMDLFVRLSKEVMKKLAIQYPQKAEDFVRQYQFLYL